MVVTEIELRSVALDELDARLVADAADPLFISRFKFLDHSLFTGSPSAATAAS
jgi:hypothetical protein